MGCVSPSLCRFGDVFIDWLEQHTVSLADIRSEMRQRCWSDDSSGHGEAHHERVRRNAMGIAQESNRSVDREVLSAAALTHDVHRV
jgi:HD superfamily phosphodiesterase